MSIRSLKRAKLKHISSLHQIKRYISTSNSLGYVMNQFEMLGVEENIVKAIGDMNFEVPTPVQEKVIPQLINEEKNDLIVLAQTGTGKTAAFGLPIVQQVDTKLNKIQFLILSPTRELCLQIADDISAFAKYKASVKIVPVFGGASIERQIQLIRNGAQIISATPGRLVDLIERKIVDLSKVKIAVLDEADEMLNMGFRDELEAILSKTPANKTTLLFSATMPNEVRAIANTYMKNPQEIVVGRKNAGAENVNHVCYYVQNKDRYLALKRIVDYHPEIYGIIFCRTRRETQEVADMLMKDGYNADALHGDLSQAQRDVVMNKFRIKHLQILVATDVAARGLDVDYLTHVINYNLPEELEIYTHRSGRTGRAGRNGTSIVISGPKEKSKIQQIEKKINKKFTIAGIPLGKDVCEKQLFHLIDRMEKVEVDSSEIEPYLPAIIKKLEWLDREELIKKFVSVEFNHFINYYKNSQDLNVITEGRKKGQKANVKLTRFFINLGRTDGLKPRNLMQLVGDFTGISDIEIGDIELLKNFSFFEADTEHVDLIMKSFKDKSYKDRKIDLEISVSKKKSGDGGGERRKDRRPDDDRRRGRVQGDERRGRGQDDERRGGRRRDDDRSFSRKEPRDKSERFSSKEKVWTNFNENRDKGWGRRGSESKSRTNDGTRFGRSSGESFENEKQGRGRKSNNRGFGRENFRDSEFSRDRSPKKVKSEGDGFNRKRRKNG